MAPACSPPGPWSSPRGTSPCRGAQSLRTELTEQGQVTDRYTKAIEQLGSDKLDVRIGGIYALERVARDSARDHPTVMEVLDRVHPRALTRAVAAAESRMTPMTRSDDTARRPGRRHRGRAPGSQSATSGPLTSPARASPARTSAADLTGAVFWAALRPRRGPHAPRTSATRISPARTSLRRTSPARTSLARTSLARTSLVRSLTGPSSAPRASPAKSSARRVSRGRIYRRNVARRCTGSGRLGTRPGLWPTGADRHSL